MGTPTMGGILILLSIGISTLLWADLSNPYVWIVLAVMVIFGAVGWADDWIKVRYKDNAGLPAKKKFFWTSVGSLGAGIALYIIATQQDSPVHTANMLDLLIPFFKNLSIPLSSIPLGIGFIIFTYLVINGGSNAVNLTDGLDGLAIMPIVLVAAGLGVFAYLAGDIRFANYLHIPYVKYTSELVIICAAMIGAGLAFLWYNAHPAQVFMGDVGALSLGAMLGTIAVMVRQEIVFAIMGGVFVVEAISVFLQIGSLRMRNKRVFLMAPLHHHYEKKGWRETQVVIRFWIITIMLQAVVEKIRELQVKNLLDIGCGEGYYTDAMQHQVMQCIGVDIAKNAVQVAAKLNKDVTWIVGTGATLPVLDHSIDLCTSLFSPIPEEEILRVLKPKAYLMVVTPAPEHLYGMREGLFDEVKAHEPQKAADYRNNAVLLCSVLAVDLNLHQPVQTGSAAIPPYSRRPSVEGWSKPTQAIATNLPLKPANHASLASLVVPWGLNLIHCKVCTFNHFIIRGDGLGIDYRLFLIDTWNTRIFRRCFINGFAISIFNTADEMRLNAISTIGNCGIASCHLNWKYLWGTERNREVTWDLIFL
ncbi:unnamed protein product [Oppiella nova]|uniref:Methyltransferase type 11 domain-containing protein n=1 Tax=Oppiella nova TaxID=334625 RepID=A0A7R9LBT1_9ACAR|nr:unnamed protein product [Oppiella nova]CAG2160412.1 unnamed protein product [Oppiella nova]